MSIYTHTQVKLPKDAVFKISPSAISKFFELPSYWYRSEVLGEDTFTGSTASVLGTTIHHVAEAYGQARIDGTTPDAAAIRTEISTDLRALSNPDVDKSTVLDLYPDMANELISQYLADNPPTQVEYTALAEVKDGIYLGGSVDARTGSTIVDYKNVSTKPKTDKIPWNYFIQLMAYAWADKQNGIHTDRIRLVYTVRATKTLPIRVFVVNHQITQADWKAIEDVLTLIADTILLSKAQPELNYLLFKSMSLKS